MMTLIRYAVFLLSTYPLLAGPIEDTFGAGARNKGMAGAGLSIAEDYTATFYNPSLLALCRGSRLSFGYDYIHTNLDPNPEAEQLGDYNAINLGFCLKPLNQVGIGVYSNFSMGPIEFTANTLNTKPTFIMYAGDLKAFSMMMGAGYAPFKQLSLGIGMSMATGVSLGADLTVNTVKSPGIVAKFPAQISPIVGVIAGVTVTPLKEWRLSAVYRSATYGQIDIKATTSFNNAKKLTETDIKGFLSYSPHQIAVGSSYFLADKWLFSTDVTYYLWSQYQGPFLTISNSSTSTFVPDLKIAPTSPPNFSDVVVPRGGVEYLVWDKLKLRAGYSFRMSPAPQPTGIAKLFDASAHRVSIGAGYEFQLYQNIFLIADTFFAADILLESRGTALNTGILIGAEYD